jgi:hypothetical protein
MGNRSATASYEVQRTACSVSELFIRRARVASLPWRRRLNNALRVTMWELVAADQLCLMNS